MASHHATIKLDLRQMMVCVLVGVIAGVIASVAERADAAITGGNATPLGFLNAYTWLMLSAVIYGPLGALVTTEVQALIGLITMANPLSWLWPFINAIFAIAAGTASALIQRLRSDTGILMRVVAVSFICALIDIPATYFVMVVVLGLPLIAYYVALPLYLGLQLLPATFLTYLLMKTLESTKIV